jgi:uncharacterized protein (TIRG00374 family)
MLMDEPRALSRRRQPGWLLVVTLALAGVLLYLAVRKVDWAETVETLRRGNLALLGAALGVFSLACLVRGLRWRVLLSAEKPIPLPTVFWAMMTGYLGNSYLPARAGEVIRSVTIGLRGGVSVSFALATALTERISDAVILVAASALALSGMERLPEEMLGPLRGMALVGLSGAAIIFVAPRMGGLVRRVIARLPVKPALRGRLEGLAANFLVGAGALQHAGRLGQFLLYSAGLWSLDTVTASLVARSFGLSLNPAQVFVLLAALGIASALPSTPGYVGVYQYVARLVLVPFGLSESQALAYIIAFQGVNYLGITIWGAIGLWGPRLAAPRPAAAQSRQGPAE